MNKQEKMTLIDDSVEKGYVLYTKSDSSLTIQKVYVCEDYRGQGLASKLMEQFVSFAKKENKKIIPECEYAKKYSLEHPQLTDYFIN